MHDIFLPLFSSRIFPLLEDKVSRCEILKDPEDEIITNV